MESKQLKSFYLNKCLQDNNYIQATRVPMWVAQSFDTKIDDGAGNTGNVRWSTLAGVAYPGPPADPNNVDNLFWVFDR